jgi:hypothetical protein
MQNGVIWRTGIHEEMIESKTVNINGTDEVFLVIDEPCVICRGNK